MQWLFGSGQAAAGPDPGSQVVDAILSAAASDHPRLYSQLPQFLPRVHSAVLTKLFPAMAQLLFKSPDNEFKALLISILHTLLFDPASGQAALDVYVAHPTFATGLLGTVVPFNEKLFDIIDRLFEIGPTRFHVFVLAQPQSMQPMLRVITDTKNERAAASFRRIVSSNRALVGLDPRRTATLPSFDFLVLFEWFQQHLPASISGRFPLTFRNSGQIDVWTQFSHNFHTIFLQFE